MSVDSIGDQPRRRGRPTDPGLERRVLDIARRHLAVHGYARMTIADVAEEAGITRPTVYKRWPSKADLVTAALRYSVVSERVAAKSVTNLPAREAIRTIMRTMAEVVASPEGFALFGSVLLEEQHNPELIALVRQHLVEPGYEQLTNAVTRAQHEGILRLDLDVDALVAMLYGGVLLEYLRRGVVGDLAVDRLVAAVWPAIEASPERDT